MSENKIQEYLVEIKAEGKVSPSGMHWNDFFLLLKQHKRTGEVDPPMPLILAASGESPASKQDRLEAQLTWAQTNNCLELALDFLKKLPIDKWSTSPSSKWNTSSYWTTD
jgi:hypothetical protein